LRSGGRRNLGLPTAAAPQLENTALPIRLRRHAREGFFWYSREPRL